MWMQAVLPMFWRYMLPKYTSQMVAMLPTPTHCRDPTVESVSTINHCKSQKSQCLMFRKATATNSKNQVKPIKTFRRVKYSTLKKVVCIITNHSASAVTILDKKYSNVTFSLLQVKKQNLLLWYMV
jgi:hypothetical protein